MIAGSIPAPATIFSMCLTTEPAAVISNNEDMEYVIIPEGQVIHQNGVPVVLVTGALVQVPYSNMQFLTGYHLCSVPKPPSN